MKPEDVMYSTIRSLLAFIMVVVLADAASAGQLERKLLFAKSYAGSRDRQYQVFIPSSYVGQAVPMVLVLHGCRQTELNMVNETGFRDLAERDGFIVVYPFITSYDGLRSTNCWGFFLDNHIHAGAGEVEDLHQIALQVESEFNIDPNRRYVTGLSSGAGMTVALAVAYSEYFAAAGAVAGLPYSETSSSVGFVCANPGQFKTISDIVSAMRAEQSREDEQRPVPMMIIHSRNDCTVNITGGRNIRDTWLSRYNVDGTAIETTNCDNEGVACTHQKYGLPDRSVVETVFYEGDRGDFVGKGSHYWVGDNDGEFANSTGPSASNVLWDFFRRHPFSEREPPAIAITSGAASGTSVVVAGTASSESGSIADVTVRLDGMFPRPEQTAAGTVSWSATFESVPDNAAYVPVATARDNAGITTSVIGDPITVGSPPENQPPQVTIDDVSVSTDCITVAGRVSDPEGLLSSVAVELGTRGLQPATLQEGNYRYQECGLPGGVYSTAAEATDRQGVKSRASGSEVSVDDVQSVTADWQAHMAAGRIRVYAAPCPSVGFGTCDAQFSEIFLVHQFNSFPLHKKARSDTWYLNVENMSQ
jgi:poly(hydroxyalkanoate) depolymerase family esterase